LRILFSRHAREMLAEGNISEDLVREAILKPDRKEEKEGDVCHFIRKVGERFLRLVVRGRTEPYTVLTVFYDRRLRRKGGQP
jgi:hypothetical protein